MSGSFEIRHKLIKFLISSKIIRKIKTKHNIKMSLKCKELLEKKCYWSIIVLVSEIQQTESD